MIYHAPSTVVSPKDYITAVNVIHDGGPDSFSVAIVKWGGSDCIGIRWNISMREKNDPVKISNRKICTGNPASHGMPTWFILPVDILKSNSEIRKILLQEFPES